jgi:hypothetical protein
VTVKLTADVLLLAGLAVATLGMILVVLGVIYGGLFLPGVIALLIGQLICAGAGLFGSFRSGREPA